MDNKVIAGLLALGLIIGALITYPIAQSSQPVKTVTKTQTKTVVVGQIQNGQTLKQVLGRLGTPAASTVQPSAKNNYVGCEAWVSKTSGQPQKGDWEITLCVKVQ